MDILGVGGFELLMILLIMVVVAGPKRIITWSYELGRYLSVIRRLWSETAKQLQKELDDSGVDVQIPKDLPTRQDLSKEIGRIAMPITKPMNETMQNLKVTADDVRRPLSMTPPQVTTPKPVTPESAPPPPAESNGSGDFGTWSGKSST